LPIKVKDAASVFVNATFSIIRASNPELEIVTFCAALLVPTTPFPNWRLSADTATEETGAPDTETPPPPHAQKARDKQRIAALFSRILFVAAPNSPARIANPNRRRLAVSKILPDRVCNSIVAMALQLYPDRDVETPALFLVCDHHNEKFRPRCSAGIFVVFRESDGHFQFTCVT
jgi:hypothetical protein